MRWYPLGMLSELVGGCPRLGVEMKDELHTRDIFGVGYGFQGTVLFLLLFISWQCKLSGHSWLVMEGLRECVYQFVKKGWLVGSGQDW